MLMNEFVEFVTAGREFFGGRPHQDWEAISGLGGNNRH